ARLGPCAQFLRALPVPLPCFLLLAPRFDAGEIEDDAGGDVRDERFQALALAVAPRPPQQPADILVADLDFERAGTDMVEFRIGPCAFDVPLSALDGALALLAQA